MRVHIIVVFVVQLVGLWPGSFPQTIQGPAPLCSDSKRKFRVGGKLRKCAWLKKKGKKARTRLCKKFAILRKKCKLACRLPRCRACYVKFSARVGPVRHFPTTTAGNTPAPSPEIEFFPANGAPSATFALEQFVPPQPDSTATARFKLPSVLGCSLTKFQIRSGDTQGSWFLENASVKVGRLFPLRQQQVVFDLSHPVTGETGLWLSGAPYSPRVADYDGRSYNKEWTFRLGRKSARGSFPTHEQFEAVFVTDPQESGYGRSTMSPEVILYPEGPLGSEVSSQFDLLDFEGTVFSWVSDDLDGEAFAQGVKKLRLLATGTDGWFIRRIYAKFGEPRSDFREISLFNSDSGSSGIWLDARPFSPPASYGNSPTYNYDVSDEYTLAPFRGSETSWHAKVTSTSYHVPSECSDPKCESCCTWLVRCQSKCHDRMNPIQHTMCLELCTYDLTFMKCIDDCKKVIPPVLQKVNGLLDAECLANGIADAATELVNVDEWLAAFEAEGDLYATCSVLKQLEESTNVYAALTSNVLKCLLGDTQVPFIVYGGFMANSALGYEYAVSATLARNLTGSYGCLLTECKGLGYVLAADVGVVFGIALGASEVKDLEGASHAWSYNVADVGVSYYWDPNNDVILFEVSVGVGLGLGRAYLNCNTAYTPALRK